MKNLIKKLTPFISLAFFVLALGLLHRELGQYTPGSIVSYISQISTTQITLSVMLCALSYLVLTMYDTLSAEYIGKKLSYSKTAKAGFIGYGFSHTLGMNLLTGGSIRYRLYSAWGLSGLDVSKIVGFNALTFWMGFCTSGGVALLLYSATLPQNIVPVSFRVIGIILLAIIALYGIANVFVKQEISLWRWSFSLPGLRMTCKQLVIATLDWAVASSVLYVLLPHVGIPFWGFFGAFLLAQFAGLFSQVPGGLGVFESVIVLYLTNFIDASSVLGILLFYRLIYYLIPFILSAILLAYHEYHVHKHKVKKLSARAKERLPWVIPGIAGLLVVIGCFFLILQKIMPAGVPGIAWLGTIISLPVVGLSHVFTFITGFLG